MRFGIVAVSVVALFAITSPIAGAAPPTLPVAEGVGGACGVHAQPEPAAAPVAWDEPPVAERWLAASATQEQLASLRSALSGDPAFVEITPAIVEQTLFVLVAPGASLTASSQRSIAKSHEVLKGTAKVQVVRACASKSDVDQRHRAVADALLQQSAGFTEETGTVQVSADYATGDVIVAGSGSAAPTVAAASKQDRVRVEQSADLGNLSRHADASPHYGGGEFWTYSYGAPQGACTSGLGVYNGYGVRMMLTAAHCGTNPMTAWSSGNLIGTIYPSADYDAWQPGQWFAHDFAVLYDGSQTYSNGLYTDPGAPVNRFVTSFGNPGVGSYVCTNGAITKAVCSVRVDTVNTQVCYFDDLRGRTICTTDMTTARKAGNLVAQPGDSGGTVYQGTGATSAKANGLIKGAYGSGVGPGTDGLYLQQIDQINALGVHPLTS